YLTGNFESLILINLISSGFTSISLFECLVLDPGKCIIPIPLFKSFLVIFIKSLYLAPVIAIKNGQIHSLAMNSTKKTFLLFSCLLDRVNFIMMGPFLCRTIN